MINLISDKVPPGNSTANAVALFSWNGLLSFAPMNDYSYGPKVFVRSFSGQLTANRVYSFPDKSGVLALTSDIPTLNTLALSTLQI